MELKFDAPGKHFYETGVSKGVLFVKSATGSGFEKGVVWNGLTAVTESPEGAEETAIYADNIKYLSLRSAEDFKATIEAYTYPDEFGECDGSASLGLGVKISQQVRKSFAFCYQTKKGNEENAELGYIIHIIYGCTCSPSERAYTTVNDSPEAITFSWEVSSIPVNVTGFKPTAHLEIDSTLFVGSTAEETAAAQAKLKQIVDALYGTDPAAEGETGTDSTLLMPDDIIAILNPPAPNAGH